MARLSGCRPGRPPRPSPAAPARAWPSETSHPYRSADGAGRGAYAACARRARTGHVARSAAALARRAAAGLLVTLAGLMAPALGLGGLAQAATLVSNTGQTTSASGTTTGPASGFLFSNAQAFTTGGNAQGYTLESVSLDVSGWSDNCVLAVSLHADDSGAPGDLIASLGSISPPASGLNTFSAPANTALTASTTYWLLVQGTGDNTTMSLTASNAEDSGGADGWTIADDRLWRNMDSAAWSTAAEVLRIEVTGTLGGGTTTSSDATLSGLSLSAGTLAPAFASATTSYTAMVANSVSQVTVTPTTTDANATVAYLDASDMALADADAITAGHQAALAVGENTDGSETIYAGCMTVGIFTDTVIPFRNVFSGYSSIYGSLSSAASFTYNSTPYTVDRIAWINRYENDVLDWSRLQFSTTPLLPLNDGNRLVLLLDNSLFLFSDAVARGINYDQWDADDLDWSEDDGVAVKLIRLNAPGAPTNLTATAASSTQIDLSWDAPSKTGGSAITGYRIEVSSDGGTTWTDLVVDTASTDTAYEHTGLTAGAARRYRVSAINAIGTGDASDVDDATTESAATCPSLAAVGENTDGSETIWSACLTVYEGPNISPDGFGFQSATSEGALTSTSFSHDNRTFEFNYFGTEPDSADCTDSAFTIFSYRAGWNYAESSWVLHLGSHTLDFGDANEVGSGEVTWCGVTHTDLGWSDGSAVAAKIVRRNAPGAPTNLTATTTSGTEVALAWTAPVKTGGSGLTGYEYRYGEDGGDTWTQDWTEVPSSDADTTGYTVAGLTAGTAYTFEVRAVNAVGESDSSNQDSATPGAVDTTPPALDDVGVVVTDPNVVALVFNEALDPVSVPDTSAFTVTVEGTRRDVIEVDLDGAIAKLRLASPVRPGETVTVSYTPPATNPLQDAAGNAVAAWANREGANQRLAIAPDAPGNLVATPGDTTITLSWETPWHNGSAITGYAYRGKTTGDYGTWMDIANSAPGEANANSVTVTGRINGVQRTYQVRAVNAVGNSLPSNAASPTFTPLGSTPGAPRGLQAEAFEGEVTLRWEAPSDDGGLAVTHYQYTHDRRHAHQAWAHAGKHRSTTVQGLTGGERHTFRVRAVNALGAGEASLPVSATPLARAPGAPAVVRNLSVRTGDSSRAELSWREVTRWGDSPAWGYRIEVCEANCGDDESWDDLVANTGTTETAYVDEGLAPGAIRGRQYRVSAINTSGKAGRASRAAALPPTAVTGFYALGYGVGTPPQETVHGLELRFDVAHPDGRDAYVRAEPQSWADCGEVESAASVAGLATVETRLALTRAGAYVAAGSRAGYELGGLEPCVWYRVTLDFVATYDSPRAVTNVERTLNPGQRTSNEIPVTPGPDWPQVLELDTDGNAVPDTQPLDVGMGETVSYRLRLKRCEGRGARRLVQAGRVSSHNGRFRAEPVEVEGLSPEFIVLACNDGDPAQPGPWSEEIRVEALALAEYPSGLYRSEALLAAPFDEVWTHEVHSPSAAMWEILDREGDGGTYSGSIYRISGGQAEVRARVRVSVLERPGNVRHDDATCGVGGGCFAWDAVPGATAYNVQWKVDGAGYGDVFSHQWRPVEGTAIHIGGAGHVTMRVRAYSASAASPWSAQAERRLSLSVADATGSETSDTAMAFTVSLSPAATVPVTVDYATQNGSATAPADYTETSGTLTFAPGKTRMTVGVGIVDDTIEDDGETFRLSLSNPVGAALVDAEATGTIRNTEAAPVVAGLSATYPPTRFTSTRHTGRSDRPQVVVAFSEAVTDVAAMWSSAAVTGGSLVSIGGHTEPGLANAWVFFLKPAGDGDVTFRLRPDRPCGEGICTAAGKRLTGVPQARAIPGPSSTAPAASLAVGGGEPVAGSFAVTVTFPAAVSGFGAERLSAGRVGGGAAAVTGFAALEAGRVWTARVASGGGGRLWVRAGAAQTSDGRSSLPATLVVDVDASGNAVAAPGPAVTAVAIAAGPLDGAWRPGDEVTVTLAFSEPVAVNATDGRPSVGIAADGTAHQALYAGGTERALRFAWTAPADGAAVSRVEVVANSLVLVTTVNFPFVTTQKFSLWACR